MRTLTPLMRYNAWANERVFDLCQGADAETLRAADKGSTGSVEGTLKHLVQVEDAYLAMLQGHDLQQALGDREAYAAHDLAWFSDRSRAIADGFQSLLAARQEPWLDEPMQVPWFDFPMTMRDGLLQVIAHSAQHRAQVLSALGAHGANVPDLDYVLMVGEEYKARGGGGVTTTAMSAITIRPMREDEIDETVRLWHATKLVAYPYLPLEQSRTIEDDTRFFRAQIMTRDQIWVAHDGSAIVGFLGIEGDYIDRLYVHPDHQGRGVGSALMAKAMELSPTRLWLHTHQQNEQARAFYEHRGFRPENFGISPPPESAPDLEYHWEPA